jgi:hypothetical protein
MILYSTDCDDVDGQLGLIQDGGVDSSPLSQSGLVQMSLKTLAYLDITF